MEKSRPSRRQKPKLFSVPQPQRYEIRRDHLFKQLEANPDHKLIAVIAPSGYGKTTFLAQYVREQDRPVAWFDLRVDHADPAHLEREVGLAVMHSVSGVLPKNFLEIENLTGRRASQISRYLDFAEQNIDFVFDGLHLLSIESARWLQEFISDLPEGHRVIISGYTTLNFPLSWFIIRNHALVIDQKILAITREEIKSYFEKRELSVDVETVKALSDGWFAFAVLYSIENIPYSQPEDLIRTVMQKLDMNLQIFITEASVLETLTSKNLENMGLLSSKDSLKLILNSGLPITVVEKDTYRMHSMYLISGVSSTTHTTAHTHSSH
jgi:LuxR family transcriptional regulator, maltose regulon positive regulatory protein